MRPVLVLLAATVIAAQPAAAQQPTRATSRALPTAREFEALYQRFLDGIRLRDTLRYRDLLTADYRYVGGDSARVIRGRSARLAFDLAPGDEILAFVLERCDLAIRPTVAVGPCWYRLKSKSASDGRIDEGHGVSLTTFVLDGARWRIAATRPSSAPVR